ncbi:hypothetical protein TIFTF001_035866 [Ficus carica]|uniref:Retrotransposon gag domain-containing protein n=1 Tax=Ficus carica TaxID=3494 RepID=A0AA88E2P6_FICCA|nr:hypothetical protein TIFTF001_035866 [Ficus carica]
MSGGTWVDFCSLITARYGPLPDEDTNMPFRDPEIYSDMYLRRYLSHVANWRAYSNESMGHYCRRFRDAMLPYIPRDLDSPVLQALHLLREGLPPDVMLFVLAPMMGMTLESMTNAIMEAEIIAHMIQATALEDDHVILVDDAGIGGPLFQGGPILPQDPIPAMPLQEIPSQEAEAATLQQQLLEQQQETNRLREQIARLNQIPHANEVPPQDNPVPPVVPRQMKAPEFEGPTDPIEANNWLIDIQVILDFMGLTEQEKDFVAEFRTMYYNREILAAQQDEFNSLKQGSMTVMKAVKKFELLAHLCLELVPNETEKVRRMMKMFRKDIAKQVSAGSSPPTLVSDYISRAIRVEYWINQDKEARAQIFKAKKEEKAVFGKNKMKGNATGQGQQRNYPQKKNNRGNEGRPLCEKLHLKQPEPEPSVPE